MKPGMIPTSFRLKSHIEHNIDIETTKSREKCGSKYRCIVEPSNEIPSRKSAGYRRPSIVFQTLQSHLENPSIANSNFG